MRSSKRSFPQTVEHVCETRGDPVIAFSGAGSIGEALRYVGCTLWADAPQPAAQTEGSLIGFRVFDRQGELWGTVAAQPQFSLNQVLEIQDGSGAVVYVPWHESLVVKVDRRSRSLVIDPPAGLRELNK